MLNPYLTNSYRYLTNIYMINLKLTPTDQNQNQADLKQNQNLQIFNS